jgi:hypothetical protein
VAPNPNMLLQLMRVLRNLCAGGEPAGDALSDAGVGGVIPAIVDAVLSK